MYVCIIHTIPPYSPFNCLHLWHRLTVHDFLISKSFSVHIISTSTLFQWPHHSTFYAITFTSTQLHCPSRSSVHITRLSTLPLLTLSHSFHCLHHDPTAQAIPLSTPYDSLPTNTVHIKFFWWLWSRGVSVIHIKWEVHDQQKLGLFRRIKRDHLESLD